MANKPSKKAAALPPDKPDTPRVREEPAQPSGATAAMRRESWEAPFLAALAETGNVFRSCQRAGVARSTVYERREQDEAFRAEWEAALEDACDLLEEEARRRAFHGTEKPVFYRGAECGRILEYSDTLMLALLRAHRPEKYRERLDHRLAGPDGGPLQVERPVDLSQLTDEELDALACLVAKAAPQSPEPGGDRAGT